MTDLHRVSLFVAAAIFLAATTHLHAECTLKETTVQGEPAIVIENEYVRLRARPTIGGRLDEFFYKPTGKNLTSPTDGAVLADRVWNYANRDVYQQWQTGVYNYEIEEGPDRVAVTMTGPGTVGIGRRMTFEKTIALTSGSSAVRADYRFSIAQAAMKPVRAGLWWHNRLGVPGETTRYFVPMTDGVRSVAYGAGGGGQWWWYEPARGWTAALGESGTGIAAIVEFPRLMCFYQFMGGDLATAEWAFRTKKIPNGESLQTTLWLVPFAGQGAVAGAGRRVVAQIDAPDKRKQAAEITATIRLSAPVPWTANVNMTLRRLPDGKPELLESWTAELGPNRDATHELTVNLDQPGTCVLSGKVLDGDTLETDFFHEIVVGERTGRIAIEPRQKRVGRVGERFSDKIAAKGTGPEDRQPSEEIVTPHVKWGKPYAQKPVKALILNDMLVGRETVELAQRLQMDYTAPTITTDYAIGSTEGMFGTAMTLEHVMDNLRNHLKKDYDVILIGGLSAEVFADDVMDTILQKVEAGTGLVWANPSDCSDELWKALPFDGFAGGSRPEARWQRETDHYLTIGIPWQVLPATEMSRYNAEGRVLARAKDYPLVAVNEYGDGRVVGLGYSTSWQGPGSYSNGLTPWIQFAPVKFAYWKYYHSLLAKSVLWAGRREPHLQIQNISVGPQQSGPNASVPQLQVRMHNPAAAASLTAHIRLIDQFGSVNAERNQSVKIPSGEANLSLELPDVDAGGMHLIDLILRHDGDSVDWASTSFRIQPRVEISELHLQDKMYRNGDTVEAGVRLAANNPDFETVQLSGHLRDGHDRVIAGRTMNNADVDAEANIALQLPEPLATTATFRVEARKNGNLLHAAETDILTMPTSWDQRNWGPYLDALWGTPSGAYSREYLAPHASRRVKKLGIDAVITSSSWLHDGEQCNSFQAGFRPLLMNVVGAPLRLSRVRDEDRMNFSEQRKQYAKTKNNKYLQRPYCLNASDTRQMVTEKLEKITKAVKRYRPVGYSCGDELSITHYVTPFDYDFSPVCLEEFRKWLQRQYQSLADLNDVWQTDFADWADVMPMTTGEVRDHESYAPWADHRTFMELTYANFFRFVDRQLESSDPGARVGISGSQAAEAYGGYDWWRLTDALEFAQTYDHENTGEMHRSFHDMRTAPWWGYGSTGAKLEHQLWRRLLNDNDGGSFFVYRYFFWPDYTYTESTSDAQKYLEDIHGGLARLLHECDERAADVYMHYSHPSIHGAYITGGQDTFRKNRDGWIKAIQDIGLQMKFLSYEQLERGELTEAMPAAFILPYSVAISDAEAAEIRRYVNAGGTVIADARTALMNDHCAPRPAGALDDLFGITRSTVDPGADRPTGTAEFTETIGPCDPRSITFEGFAGEARIRPDGAKVLGEMAGLPLLAVNNVGDGKAVLLNTLLDSYPRRRKVGVGQPIRKLVKNTLALAGVTPPIKADTGDDHHLYITRYISGDAIYAGILRDRSQGRSSVSLTFPETRHIYDLRRNEYLGKTDTATARITPGHCEVYSFMPYRVTGLKINLQNQRLKPGNRVNFTVGARTDGGDPGMHVFRTEVTDPSGVTRDYYGDQLTAEAGAAHGQFRLALNDPPGTWKISVTDVATGTSATASFDLHGRN